LLIKFLISFAAEPEVIKKAMGFPMAFCSISETWEKVLSTHISQELFIGYRGHGRTATAIASPLSDMQDMLSFQ